MGTKATLPYPDEDEGEVPVRTLAVRVDEGADAGLEVSAEAETLTVGTAEGNDAKLRDETVSRFHLQLDRHDDGVLVRDLGSTNGTFVGAVRVREAIVRAGTSLRVGRTTLTALDGEARRVVVHPDNRLGDLRGDAPAMRRVFARLRKIARTQAAVLVIGESGTGKELIARAIHDESPRANAPFVTVDCGSLAPNLVASELFGHERGAFTGAERQHVGAFERANGGTIFLDEIGELPRDLQPTLLGALERRRFRRVGGQKDIAVDLRIVAATNRDLRAEVNEGTFRLDLYYRLAVVTLQIPPLRERPGDVELLVRHFLTEMGHAEPLESLFPELVLDALRAYRWPGNVRELRNLVEATVAMGETPEMAQGPDAPQDGGAPSSPGDGSEGAQIRLEGVLAESYKDARAKVLAEFERAYVTHWLEASDGNVAKAARTARMDRSHLFHLIKRHRLKSSRD